MCARVRGGERDRMYLIQTIFFTIFIGSDVTNTLHPSNSINSKYQSLSCCKCRCNQVEVSISRQLVSKDAFYHDLWNIFKITSNLIKFTQRHVLINGSFEAVGGWSSKYYGKGNKGILTLWIKWHSGGNGPIAFKQTAELSAFSVLRNLV